MVRALGGPPGEADRAAGRVPSTSERPPAIKERAF